MDYRVSDKSLTAVADAIRAKAGTTEAMAFPDGFVNEVLNMSSGEKWELLADITTTEEVDSLYVNTDMSGNAFECKRIVAKMILPSETSGDSGVYFGACEGMWLDPGCMVGHHYKIRVYDILANPGFFTEFRAAHHNLDHYGNDTAVSHVRNGDVFKDLLTQFLVCRQEGNYPVGTNLKVWGVKA